MPGILGKKLGMTQVFDEAGEVVPVTVIQAGPCVVTQRKRRERDGYDAVQVGFAEANPRRAGKAYAGHFAKQGLKPARWVREFRVPAELPLAEGSAITVAHFQIGDRVHVTGTSKGKGFQGVIKRHGKAGGPASHGSRFHRTTGSIGQRTSPGEVFKNMKLPGHMGVERVTVKNLKVIERREDAHLLFIEGAVPGARNSMVIVNNAAPDFWQRVVAPATAKPAKAEKEA